MTKTSAPTLRKLNLGAGGQIGAGWINVDRAFTFETQERARALVARGAEPPLCVFDLEDDWPWPDGSIDFAVAHHLLDLLETPALMHVLREALRVLAPRGVLRISSVNFDRGFQALADHDVEWFARLGVPAELCDDARIAFDWWLDCGGARRTLLPLAGTKRLLEISGFEVEEVEHEVTSTLAAICELDSRADESWFLEARRP